MNHHLPAKEHQSPLSRYTWKRRPIAGIPEAGIPESDGQAAQPVPSRVRRVLLVVARSTISLGLIAGGIAVVAALGGGNVPQTRRPADASVPVVEVTAVEPHHAGIDFEVDGVVIPFRQIEVPAEVAGRVAYRSENCRIGRTVRQGELLLRIDPQDYELEVGRLDEQRKQAEAEIHELDVETAAGTRQIELAQEDLAIKRREVERYERIDDPGVYSKSEIDTARLKELQARDAVQTEVDRLELLTARRQRLTSARELASRQSEKARLDLARTEIHSPIDGVITREPMEQGCYVARGGVAVVIQDMSCMEIKCSLQMHQMHWLWQSGEADAASQTRRSGYRFPETPATVIYELGGRSYRWDGTLADYAGVQVDPQTRMVPCRVYVREPAEPGRASAADAPPGLMAGMFVTVQVHAKPKLPLFRIPETAVQPGNKVWLVREIHSGTPPLGKLHLASVRVAYSAAETVLAYGNDSPLGAGDFVVSSPVSCPAEGMTVEVRSTDRQDSHNGPLPESAGEVAASGGPR